MWLKQRVNKNRSLKVCLRHLFPKWCIVFFSLVVRLMNCRNSFEISICILISDNGNAMLWAIIHANKPVVGAMAHNCQQNQGSEWDERTQPEDQLGNQFKFVNKTYIITYNHPSLAWYWDCHVSKITWDKHISIDNWLVLDTWWLWGLWINSFRVFPIISPRQRSGLAPTNDGTLVFEGCGRSVTRLENFRFKRWGP